MTCPDAPAPADCDAFDTEGESVLATDDGLVLYNLIEEV